jgi:hypothetical protein
MRTYLCLPRFRSNSAVLIQKSRPCTPRRSIQYTTMGKKRKAGGKPPGELREDQTRQNVQTRYHVDEQFADSEDDFFAGRDKILLEEGPASKRRRKAEEEGRAHSIDRFIGTAGADKTYRTIPSTLRRGSPRL